jgi:threonine/homoserine/homoserine lactone efflux protein
MTSFLEDWMTVFVVASLGMISPGPNFVITIKNSLLHSRLAGMWTAVGVAVGNLVHVVFSLLGIAVIVSQSILLFNTLKWFGVAYLAYIGLKSLLARREDVEELMQSGRHDTRQMGSLRALWVSFWVSLLNPKVTLFYLVLFTQVVEPETPLLFRIVGAVAHWVERATGAILIVLGARLAFSRTNG